MAALRQIWETCNAAWLPILTALQLVTSYSLFNSQSACSWKLVETLRYLFVYLSDMLFLHKPIAIRLTLVVATATAMSTSSKTIAVIGGGSVGSTLANSLVQGFSAAAINDNPAAQSSPKVVIGARDPAKTQAALAGTDGTKKELTVLPLTEAIAAADVLILATPSVHTDDDIEALAKSLGDVTGKVIIDATNPLSEFSDGLQVRWMQGTSGGEVLQKCLPESKVYKCFNTIGVDWMDRDKALAGGMEMLYCGPDSGIEELVALVGFQPRYVGPIRYARNLEAMAELWIHCAIPPMPAKQLGRDWGFALKGSPEP